MTDQPTLKADRERNRTLTPDHPERSLGLPNGLSAQDAAQQLGVSERTIRRAIRGGQLTARKQGGSFHITSEALDRYREWRALRPTRRRRLRMRPHSLPAPITSFIGRERAIATVAALLRSGDVPLLTLTGPGGVGKTRLALQVATDVAPDFADGAAFVSLASVRSADLVLPTVAQALGVREKEERPPLERLVAFLREQETLLVLDNFEQVTGSGPALIDLLCTCPGLTILVTSRSPLHLSAERLFAVPPLALPESRGAGGATRRRPPLDELAAVESVRLFIDRAQAATTDFALTAENAPAIAAMCERTDGLPLAIELAAARTRVLAPADLLARFSPQLPVLTGGPRDQPDRLRTMRDAIAWSYDLLSSDEQALFRGLAIFVGGFGYEAAERVTGSQGIGVSGRTTPRHPDTPIPRHLDTPTVLDLLTTLVDESLVQRGSGPGGETRYGMLETVREFGLEALAASGEDEAVRHAHADWCVAFAERAEPELAGPDHVVWWERIEGELGNIRSAHAWLFACGDAERALRLGGALSWFWSAAGYLEEGRNLFARLIAMPGAEDAPPALARVMSSAADLEHWLANLDRAQEHYEWALAIFRLVDDGQGIVATLRGLGSVAIDQGQLEHASSLLSEVLARAPETGAAWEAAAAARLLAIVAFSRGEYADAIHYSEAALAGWQALGDTGHVGSALAMLARAALAAGDHPRATAVARDVLSQLADAGDDVLVCDCFEVAAGLAETAGVRVRAARLLAAAEAVLRRIGTSRRPAMQAMFDRSTAAVRQALGEPAFAAAWAAGEASPLAEATAEAFAALDLIDGAQRPARSLPAEPGALTPRELEVLRLLVDGLSDKEIAYALGVRTRTVSDHVAVIRRKLGVPSRTAAATVAVRSGLLSS